MPIGFTSVILLYGASGQDRTADALIFSQALSQLSYRGKDGALGWIRTSDIIGVAVRPLRPLRHECKWLGWLDLNQRMSASKADALPLGDTPILVLPTGLEPVFPA